MVTNFDEAVLLNEMMNKMSGEKRPEQQRSDDVSHTWKHCRSPPDVSSCSISPGEMELFVLQVGREAENLRGTLLPPNLCFVFVLVEGDGASAGVRAQTHTHTHTHTHTRLNGLSADSTINL